MKERAIIPTWHSYKFWRVTRSLQDIYKIFRNLITIYQNLFRISWSADSQHIPPNIWQKATFLSKR